MKRPAAVALSALVLCAPGAALAWGSTGHRIVGEAAVRALPSEVPAFLRTPGAVRDVGEFSREPDRSKGSGKVHDNERDSAHFLDLGDDGKIFGGPALANLPATREDYDAAMRAVGWDSWKAGYLPYSIEDRYEQLAKDFAYWRVLAAAEANPQWKAHRAWFAADRKRRETQILEDMGQLSHFVADGSQPLHVTIHFNGWGPWPNPQGFSDAKVHGPFEGDLVREAVSPAAVQAEVAPLRDCSCAIAQETADYLARTAREVVPFYEMEKAGGLRPGDPRGPAFATRRLAAGAAELRDLVVMAWRTSPRITVGYKPIAVGDVLSGKVDPYPALYGLD